MRERFDGFNAAKRRKFFETLEKTGCLADAAHVAGISKETVRRWRAKDADFAREFDRRLEVAAGALERLAWERATVGIEEKIWRNGELWQVRVKPSDAMLRLLMQGANPKKYGRTGRGGLTRKQIEKRLRKEIEAEMEERYKPEHASLDEVCAALAKRLKAFPPTLPNDPGAYAGYGRLAGLEEEEEG